jgi:hypothetical protein
MRPLGLFARQARWRPTGERDTGTKPGQPPKHAKISIVSMVATDIPSTSLDVRF